MFETILPAVVALALAAAVLWWRGAAARRQAWQELLYLDAPPQRDEGPPPAVPFARPRPLLPWAVAALTATALHVLAGLAPSFAFSLFLLVGLLGGQLETRRVQRRTARAEAQLADAIDLMVGALQIGAGLMSALEGAAREARPPLRPELDELLGRLRFGDDPKAALANLERRVPLETFSLFVTALAVHWEVGGSLAPTLATVGQVVRDRIGVKRRIETQASQARASIVAVLLATYFIALVIWRNDPSRMRDFLSSETGQGIVAATVLLQGVGIVWASALSRLHY